MKQPLFFVHRSTRIAVLLIIMSMISIWVMAQDDAVDMVSPLMDDFETDELFTSMDEFNNAIGHSTWGDLPGSVELSLTEIERDGEMTTALEINYDVGAWGGFTHAFTDGESWISQDWTDFGALQFSLYGNNSGGIIQVEIFDNRNPGLNSDTAERYFFRITDDYEGWQDFTIPFGSFLRRADFQPGGAPNDGLGLNEVSGYAFGLPAGAGAYTAYLDNVMVVFLENEPIMVDDFAMDEIFLAQDGAGNDIGHVTWGDGVELNLIEALRSGDDVSALAVTYDISGFGGFSHIFNDGAEHAPQDWSAYNAISFWFLGSGTGEEIQVEIFDNLNPEAAGDSAERWFYRFVDDGFIWKQVEIPFVDFQRREDWQPDGALDDGFNLNAVTGYAFGLPAGIGNKVAVIDDIQVITIAGVDQPEGVTVATEASEEVVERLEVELEDVEPNPDLLEPIPFTEPILLADYEEGLPYLIADGVAVGYVPFGDVTGNAVIGITQIKPFTAMAIPEISEFNQALRVDYNIGAWGGYTHAITDGESWISVDATNHNAMEFWLYGNDTGGVVMIELFDNRDTEAPGDTAERYFYHMLDDYEGWAKITIPFAFFQRRTDYQPNGAPDDGFGLDAVAGYALSFPAGAGSQTAWVDNVQFVVVEDPSSVQMGGEDNRVTSVEIDESITWDSREWELLWSDEFDADAGTSINEDYWTCRTGGGGWGNNELQYYTCDLDNIAHDGEGNLVITAIEEGVEDDRCWYGDCRYTSSRIVTQDKVEFTHGRVEARIKVPEGQGLWPAFWMLGADFPGVVWPLSGEIDIMENVGYEPNIIHGTIHGPGYSGGGGIGNSYIADFNFADDFHIFAIDWDPYVIRWYVDGEMYGMISVNALLDNPWVYEDDMFLLLNVAVGGNWPGEPDETTVFPQEMLVDYVRVYQLADAE